MVASPKEIPGADPARKSIARFPRACPVGVSNAGAERAAQLRLAVEAGLDPVEVAARTLRGVRDEDLYIFTHPEMRPWLDKRLERLRAAYDKAERFVP
jgi:hypothetical protein